MPAAIDATVGGADANSYMTVANAVLYFETRTPSTAWDDATADAQIRALIMATRQIDTLVFTGEKTTTTQALKFPRVDTFDQDGEEYATNAIPKIVQDAMCEVAYSILAAGTTDTLANSALDQFSRAQVGPLSVDIRRKIAAQLPDYVKRLLSPVLGASGLMVQLVRS